MQQLPGPAWVSIVSAGLGLSVVLHLSTDLPLGAQRGTTESLGSEVSQADSGSSLASSHPLAPTELLLLGGSGQPHLPEPAPHMATTPVIHHSGH